MADAEAATALVFDASPAQQGATQFDAAGKKIIATNAEVVNATTRTIDAQGNMERALARLTRQIDPAAAAQAKLEAGQRLLERAYQRGAISAEEQSRQLGLLEQRYTGVSREAERAAAAQDAFNRVLGVSARSSDDTAKRAADIAAYGAEIDRVRAKYLPLAAAQQQYRAALLEITAAERAGALSAREATTARDATKASFAAQVVEIRKGSDEAGKSMSRFTQNAGQAGLQLQDFVVQVGGGTDALKAFGQQAPQFLGIFGPGGAIAGAVVAVLALAAGFLGLKSNSERALEEIERQATQYEDATKKAQDYVSALRAQGDQYRDMTTAGRLYREGLRGEGETLVQLTRYYQGMTEARRAYEQQGISTSGRLLNFNQFQVNRDLDSALRTPLSRASSFAGATDILSDSAAIVAGGNTSNSADLDKATAALTRFRTEGDRSTEAVLRLWNELREAAQQNGDYAGSINNVIGQIERLIPTIDRLDEAQRRQRNRQLAVSGQASPEQLRALADHAASEVGGRYQTQQRIRDQRSDLQGGMAGATPEQRAAYRSSLQALAQQQEGLTPATTQQLRGLREQADLMSTAEGAARELAQAEMELNRAARAAGQGMASAGQVTEARRLVQERLDRQYALSILNLDRDIRFQEDITRAYGESAQAGLEMEAAVRAQVDALKTAEAGTPAYAARVGELTQKYIELARAQAERQQASRNADTRNELALLEREQQLIGATVADRERELAVLRARQQAEKNGISGTDAATQAERLAARMSDVRQESEQLRNSWNELGTFGESVFQKVGDSISDGLAKGQIETIKFGDVWKAVIAQILQEAAKLAVINPLLNYALGGSRATLGGITQVAGLGSLGSLGLGGSSTGGIPITDGSGSITGYIGQASSFSTISRGLSGFNPGNYINGSSPINTGWGWLDSGLNTPIGGGFGTTTGSGYYAGTAMAGEPGFFSGGGGAEIGGSAGSGLTYGGAALGAAGVAGGLYGLYSGLQKGGVGGYTQAAGGAATAGLSAAALAGAAIPVYGWIAAAILSIAGSLLPGQKPSGKGQEYRVDLATGDSYKAGLTGSRYSAGNAEQAQAATMQIVDLANQLSSKLGGVTPTGQVAVGVTSSRGDGPGTLYLELNGEKAQFANSEDGAKQLADKAAELLLKQFRDRVEGDYRGILAASPTIDKLQENLQWYEQTYKSFQTGATAANQYQQALDQVTSSFQVNIDKANELSLSTDAITAARDKQLDQITQQRNLQLAGYDIGLTIRSMQAGGADSADIRNQVALMQFDLQATQQIADARSTLEGLGLTSDEVTARLATNEGVLAQERIALLQQQQDAVAGAMDQAQQSVSSVISSLADYARGLAYSDKSALSAQDQYALASSRFNAVSGAALAGDYNSLSQLKDYSDAYLSASRAMNGSGAAYAADFDRVTGVLGSVASISADTLTYSAQAQLVQTQTTVLASKFDELRAEVASLRTALTQAANTPARAAA